jgi:hypothetical protein
VVSSNYSIGTCAKKEWGIVVDGDSAPTADMNYDRRIPSLEKLKELPASKRAGLEIFEIIALVLYTGPLVSPASKPEPPWLPPLFL